MDLVPSIVQTLFIGGFFLVITLLYTLIKEKKLINEENELKKKIDIWEYHRKIINSHEINRIGTASNYYHETKSQICRQVKSKRIKILNDISDNMY